MSHARIESLERRLFLAAQPVVLGGDGLGTLVPISNGDVTPSRADSTDFGYDVTNQYEVSRSFTLQNTGDATLELRPADSVILLGDPSFTVKTQPASASLGAKVGETIDSTAFTISFKPTMTGTKSTQVQVVAADGTTLFSFMLAGTGLSASTAYGTSAGGGSVAMQYATTLTGSGTAAMSDSVVDVSYTGYLLSGSPGSQFNFGSASAISPLELTIGGSTVIKGWSAGLSGMLAGEKRVLFVPKALAYSDTTPSIPGGLPDADTYIFEVELVRFGVVAIPAVYGGNGLGTKALIPKGDTSPMMGDSTDFGYANVGTNGYTLTRTFSLENTGSTAFTLQSSDPIALEGIAGYDHSGFTVKTQPGTRVIDAQGTSTSSTTFTISFKPVAAGLQKTTVKVLAQDGTTLYSFVISGTGLAGTALSGTATGGASATMECATTLSGSGPAATDGSNVSVYYSGYLLDGSPTARYNFDSKSVGSAPFTVTIGAGQVIKGWDLGLKGMQVGETRWLFIPATLAYGSTASGSIPANSPLIFKVDMVRLGTTGSFTVSGNSQTIANGDTVPSPTDFTDFGTASLNVPISRTFSLSGTQGDVTASIIGGSGAFEVLSHSSTSVVVRFLPTTTGEASATLSISPAGSSAYTFKIKGNTYAADRTGVAYSYDAVIVQGTAGDDTARVTATTTSSTTTYQVTLNGVAWPETFTATTGVTLSRILMDGGAGNDNLEVANSVTLASSLTGGAGNDTLTGSSGADTIDGGAGDDSLVGNAGGDSLIGGVGDDTLDGGFGNDTLSGALGADTFDGGPDTDTITYAGEGRTLGVKVSLSRAAGNGSSEDARSGATAAGDSVINVENIIGTDFADTLSGNSAANSIAGGDGDDSIAGAAGNDSLDGGAGNDSLAGDTGDDSITGGDGSDLIKGGSGADRLRGDAGNDTIYGGSGADLIFGNAGDDAMYGDAGNDVLWGGFGADDAWGGAGTDAMSYADESRTIGVSVSQNGAADDGSADDVSGSRRDNVAGDIEIIGTTPFADTVVAAGRGNRIIWTYAGDDTITGTDSGRNQIWGGAGNDTIHGGRFGDMICGDDSSSPTGKAATDGNDVIYGGAGSDTIVAGGGADTLNGEGGNDLLYARDSQTDTLDGGSGNNRTQVDGTDTYSNIRNLLA